jgi:hypothetical protein
VCSIVGLRKWCNCRWSPRSPEVTPSLVDDGDGPALRARAAPMGGGAVAMALGRPPVHVDGEAVQAVGVGLAADA